jgi:hypothetical protein
MRRLSKQLNRFSEMTVSTRLQSCLAITMLLILAGAPAASAQWVPDTIPQDPEESLADKQRKRFEQRHHATLSNLFVGNATAGMLDWRGNAPMFGSGMEVGKHLQGGGAVYVAAGVAMIPQADLFGATTAWSYLSASYDLPLSAVFPQRDGLRNVLFGLGAGAWGGEDALLSMEISPRYRLRPHPDWEMPVGFRVTRLVAGVGDGVVGQTYIGPVVSVRYRLFRRDVLK